LDATLNIEIVLDVMYYPFNVGDVRLQPFDHGMPVDPSAIRVSDRELFQSRRENLVVQILDMLAGRQVH